ncbi:MAG: hypothetical protein IJX51_08680 [Clostridia bacterium]|nr:hypothetical protein [Clostridia bacterium]
MKYKQFLEWCNERACDGFWGFNTITICIEVIKTVNKHPFWEREKAWQKINEELKIVENIVEPTNKKIEEYIGESEGEK